MKHEEVFWISHDKMEVRHEGRVWRKFEAFHPDGVFVLMVSQGCDTGQPLNLRHRRLEGGDSPTLSETCH